MPNYNPDTGIAFGVIAGNSLDQDVFSDLMYGHHVRNLSYEAGVEEVKRQARADWQEKYHIVCASVAGEGRASSEDDFDEAVQAELARYTGFDSYEDYEESVIDGYNGDHAGDEDIYEGELENVKYRISWLGGASIVFIFESPFVAYAEACSPCVPGAGDLDNVLPTAGLGCTQCYDVPADWRAEVEAEEVIRDV